MTSDNKRTANQRNSLCSTGPRTPDGKAASRLNALKHGLTAAQVLLPDEDANDYQQFMKAMKQQLQPNGVLEQELSEAIAMKLWRLRRVLRMEAETLRYQLRSALQYSLDSGDPLGRAFLSDCQSPESMLKLSRYETSLQSQLLGLLREFRELREITQLSGFVSHGETAVGITS